MFPYILIDDQIAQLHAQIHRLQAEAAANLRAVNSGAVNSDDDAIILDGIGSSIQHQNDDASAAPAGMLVNQLILLVFNLPII
jgi:hypothetical protein